MLRPAARLKIVEENTAEEEEEEGEEMIAVLDTASCNADEDRDVK